MILFSGIADTTAVKDSWKKLNFIVEHHLEFADHHWYTSNDIDFIISAFKRSHEDYICNKAKGFYKTFKGFSVKVSAYHF